MSASAARTKSADATIATPATTMMAHHGADAPAQVTMPTDSARRRASTRGRPVGDGGANAATTAATYAVTAAANSATRLDRRGGMERSENLASGAGRPRHDDDAVSTTRDGAAPGAPSSTRWRRPAATTSWRRR